MVWVCRFSKEKYWWNLLLFGRTLRLPQTNSNQIDMYMSAQPTRLSLAKERAKKLLRNLFLSLRPQISRKFVFCLPGLSGIFVSILSKKYGDVFKIIQVTNREARRRIKNDDGISISLNKIHAWTAQCTRTQISVARENENIMVH